MIYKQAKEGIDKARNQHLFMNLFQALNDSRKKGRNDYPVAVLWENLLAKLLNKKEAIKVPAYALSRFLSLLSKHEDLLRSFLFRQIAEKKAKDIFFGSKLILFTLKLRVGRTTFLLDGKTALPLASCEIDNPISAAYHLITELNKFHTPPFISNSGASELLQKAPLERCLIAEEIFDDGSFIEHLWNQYRIKPIIPLQTQADRSKQKPYIFLNKGCYSNGYGEIFCPAHFPMSYAGFEEARQASKYRCLRIHYEGNCGFHKTCSGMAIRVPLKVNPRLFTPIPRTSYKWERHFKELSRKKLFTQYYKDFLLRFRYYNKDKKRILWLLDQIILYSAST